MNRLPKKITFIALVLLLGISGGCATQDEMFTLEDRLADLEQRNESADRQLKEFSSRLNAYDEKLASDDQNLRGRAATMRVDIDTLREEIQGLNGRIEETRYALRQKVVAIEDADRERQKQIARLEEISTENSALIQRIENYLNFEKQAPGKVQEGVPPTEAGPESGKGLPVDQLYLSSKQMFDNGEFEASRIGFAELIKRFPRSGHADNAQFWIGESYYKEKWYEKAILEYQKVIEKYPKGNKVQASLLKQGFAFFNLGDSANASLILKELIRKFPKSNEAVIARKKLKGMK